MGEIGKEGEQHQEMMRTIVMVYSFSSIHSYVEHSMFCVSRLDKLALHKELSTV